MIIAKLIIQNLQFIIFYETWFLTDFSLKIK